MEGANSTECEMGTFLISGDVDRRSAAYSEVRQAEIVPIC